MTKTKKWIIAGAALLGAGIITCTAALAALGFDFKKLGTVELVTNTYEVSGDFENITITGDTEDITFVRSEDGSCKVLCREEKDALHQVTAENNTLTITKNSARKIRIFSIMAESPKITVYLPKDSYDALKINADTGDVTIPDAFSFGQISVTLDTGDCTCNASASDKISIRTDTGDIRLSGISAAGLELTSDTGDMKLTDVTLSGELRIEEDTGDVTAQNLTCTKFTAKGETGDLSMTNVTASEAFDLKSDTGDITFSGCDAEAIYVRTDTGDVTGTLRSDKVFLTETDTGDVSVPKTVTGGRCEISTDTGDIRIKVQ
ncbi:MAG: DUF4097 family beta strand repeat protein [Oscillospiraceae bacterium]|nr:DUF4097 family beta strand repeat protein [Oscillospiraceae bacterium]